MYAKLRIISQYWLEILIVLVLTIFPFGWGWLKEVLREHGLLLPAIFFLLCECVYIISASIAVYYTGFMQGWLKSFRKQFHAIVWLELPLWGLKSFRSFIQNVTHHLVDLEFNVPGVHFWFNINRITALVQPSVTLALVIARASLPWSLYTLIILFLIVDLASTVIIMRSIGSKLNVGQNPVVRLATNADLAGILEVDRERYAEVSEEATATETMMAKRIVQSNELGSGWLWIALWKGKVIGLLSLQPTSQNPSNFKSWEDSTDNGTLQSTFDEKGENVYVVALTCTKEAPPETIDLLLMPAIAKWIGGGKHQAYFCGRMPGYHLHQQMMTPDEYYVAKDERGRPLDPQIRLYAGMGFNPVRLVSKAFSGDRESCEYGVLFIGENPLHNIPFRKATAFLIKMVAKNRYALELLLRL